MDLISFYSGNIKHSRCVGHIKYEDFINSHKYTKPKIEVLLSAIRRASNNKDKELKAELKKQLFTFTPSALIKKGQKRRYANIIRFTEYKQLDFDKIETKETAIELKNHVFKYNPEILCAYLSPSGLGVKCLLKTKRPNDIEQFRAQHKAIETHFSAYGDYFDGAVKNAILPLFLSADKNILARRFEDTEYWDQEDNTKIKYVRLIDTTFNYAQKYDDKQKQYYLEKTVRIFRSKIRSIVSDGHPQMRGACLILGSRVGAGYIDAFEAESLAISEIQMSNYLQKDLKEYLTTSKWAINEGRKRPKEYN